MVVGWRVGVAASVVALFALLPDVFNRTDYRSLIGLDGAPTGSLALHLTTWDGQHYLKLAADGWAAGEPSAAFYPLWPLLVRWAGLAVGPIAASVALANLLSLGALVLTWDLLRRRAGDGVATRAVLLQLAVPGAIFLALPYSEGLFVLLAVWLLHALERDRLAEAALAGLLLPLCRAPGLFAVLPLAAHVLRERTSPRWLAAGSPAAGWLLYLGFIAWQTNSPWTGLRAQALFVAQSSVADLLDPAGFLRGFFRSDLSIHGLQDSALDRAFLVLMLATLPALWRLDRRWFLWSFALIAVPALTVGTMATLRYSVVVTPAYLVMARWLDGPRGRSATPWLLGTLGAGQALAAFAHCNHYWVG
jgi:hypothetical protein